MTAFMACYLRTKMSDAARQYRFSVTYERKDALDASSFFGDINEQERGKWRVAVALFGIGLFALGMVTFFIRPGQGSPGNVPLRIFIIAAVALSWSVDPAFRDFTRRLWLARGRALTVDFADAGIIVTRNPYGSRFSPWSDVTSVTERADGVLLAFDDVVNPVPGMSAFYDRFRWIVGRPILWLPTRAFINDEAKWEFRDFAHRFVPERPLSDSSFFRLHIATLAVMMVVAIASYGILSWKLKMQESQLRRGLNYLAGDGVIPDDARGVELITLAATHDFAPAQYELGLMYMQGSHGVSKNIPRAAYWLKAAASAGIKEAEDNLNKIYALGRGGPADQPQHPRQRTFDKRADLAIMAQEGNVEAYKRLAVLYRKGLDGAVNTAEAVRLYQMAADRGDVEAQYNLGDMYESGDGVGKNISLAIEWYTKAANQGDSLAQDRLGHIYDDGIGVPRNSTVAIHWFTKAAEQGEVLDQFKLGQIYSDGKDVPKDIAEASKWYRQAAAEGFGAATYQLRALGVGDTASHE